MGNVRQAMSCQTLIVDDNSSVHDSIRVMLQDDRTISLQGQAFDGRQAVEQAYEAKPQMIIMDVNMPRMDGIKATAEIRRFNSSAKILFYSGHPGSAVAALASGANGFVTKAAPIIRLKAAIQAVLEGGFYVDPVPWAAFESHFLASTLGQSNFSPEQQEVAQLLVQGFTSKEIASELQKNARRIEKVRAQLMTKLSARNATALVVKLSRVFPGDAFDK